MNLEQKVYKKLLDVPKGQITTYGDLAKAVGLKKWSKNYWKNYEQKPFSCDNSMS
jgi:6-O-methylguanine DNA methyltransferase, DNA binding domain.